MPQAGREVMALGSDFIIDPAGYIVTNTHVVANAAKITVILQDNSRHPAKVIGRDEKTDLALIEYGKECCRAAQGKRTRHPWLARRRDRKHQSSIAKSLGMNPEQLTGALVASITPDSPAAKAGLKQGDVILGAAGHPIKAVHDLPRLVAAAPIGKKFDLTIRRNGKETTDTATIAEMPENPQQAATSPGGKAAADALGLQLSPISPELRRRFKIPKDVKGVVVTKVAGDGPAGALGIEPGDIIMSVDQDPATAPEQAAAALKQAATQGNILLLLNRRGTSQFVGLSVSGAGSSLPPR